MPEFRDVIPGSQVSVSQPSLAGLQAALAAGTLSSAALTGFYLQRIERLNPALHAVITVNADAPDEAAASDAARAVDGPRGPLEGIPVLVEKFRTNLARRFPAKQQQAILDVALENILDLMRALRSESSNSRILAFAVREDISAILNYAEAGADGFVTANSSIAELVEAIERTADGELLCSPRIAAQLLRRAAHRKTAEAGASGPVLTTREEQVFSLLKQGQSNKEIGATLNIAEATVKNHVHHLLEKLQVTTRGQAAAARPPAKATIDRLSSRQTG